MRHWRSLAQLGVAASLALGGAATLSAQDWRDVFRQRQDLRADYRDMQADYARINAMRADIARDRARLDEDIRCGRDAAAARDAADLARDQRALDAQVRDVRRDEGDAYWDRQNIRRDYRQSWSRSWR
jgi:hypothetical protein